MPMSCSLPEQSTSSLVRAYVLAQPSKTVEGRACWNHSGTGAYPGDWDRTAKELAENGFNMVLPNMLWGGVAHYPSDVLPRSQTFEKYGDQIAQCVAAAKKYGLQVHVWKVNWNLSTAPREFIEKIRREHRNQVSVNGEAENWLCPSHPENFQLELDSMLEVARKYDVDGLHFDYIRYPDHDKCYCDGCRSRFEQQTGTKVAKWPADCYLGRPARQVRAVALRPNHATCESRARRGQEESGRTSPFPPPCSARIPAAANRWLKTGRSGSRRAIWISSAPWTIRRAT